MPLKICLALAAFVLSASVASAATVRTEVNFRFNTVYNGIIHDFDVDDDGRADLRLRPYYRSWFHSGRSSSSSGRMSYLTVAGLNGSAIAGGPALEAGDLVDAALSYTDAQMLTGYRYSQWYRRGSSRRPSSSGSSFRYLGAWADGTRDRKVGFLGLRLGDGRFGWAEFNLDYAGSGTLLAYGYETEPGEALRAGAATEEIIVTPLPASYLLLLSGLGCVAAAARRKAARRQA